MNTDSSAKPERDPLCERALRVIRDALVLYDALTLTIERTQRTLRQCELSRSVPNIASSRTPTNQTM